MRLSIEAAVQHQYTPFIDEMKWRPTKARNGSTVTLVAGASRLSRCVKVFVSEAKTLSRLPDEKKASNLTRR